jgi:uridine phosphorylase
MDTQTLSETQLILNSDNSIFHLHLNPTDIAQNIILVGDPNRVPLVSQYFDSIRVKKRNREYSTHTGFINNKPISVVSTGVGVGNIDIVMNEIDALFNVDFVTRQAKENPTSLRFLRLGTAGTLQEDINVDTLVASQYAFSCDGLMQYYHYMNTLEEMQLLAQLNQHFIEQRIDTTFYASSADKSLLNVFSNIASIGITSTCVGFYGPQHRMIRAPLKKEDGLTHAAGFSFNQQRVLNFEMETAAIYALGKLLGHQCCSISTIINNRATHTFTKNVARSIDTMIQRALTLFC